MIGPVERILVLDSKASRDSKLSREALESEGYSVEEAADSPEGLRVLIARRPEFVVLDVLMPNMDWFVVCQRIREITDVPIIMLTSLNRDEEVVKGLEHGADDFVSKPVSPRQLIARVRAVLNRARSPVTTKDDLVYDDGLLRIDVAQARYPLYS